MRRLSDLWSTSAGRHNLFTASFNEMNHNTLSSYLPPTSVRASARASERQRRDYGERVLLHADRSTHRTSWECARGGGEYKPPWLSFN